MAKKVKSNATTPDYFLVCGLGSLGQQAVIALKRFGVPVLAIEQAHLSRYEIPDFPDLLEQLIIGDCAYEPTLRQLNLAACRAAVLATSTDQVNIETALMIRQRNPQTRLVVRSSKENLNQLLCEQLGNFIAYDPLELPANAYALAALGSETLGFFKLGDQWLHVVSQGLPPHHPWLNQQHLYQLNKKTRRILAHRSPGTSWSSQFDALETNLRLQPHDDVIYIELVDYWSRQQQPTTHSGVSSRATLGPSHFSQLNQGTPARQQVWQVLSSAFWRQRYRQVKQWFGDRPVILLATVVISLLFLLGTLLLYTSLADISLPSAFYSTAVLLLGGYGDLFENLEQAKQNQWLLQPLSLLLTLAGTAAVGILYALLTENLLAKQFSLIPRRLNLPAKNHVVIVGFGRVGQRVARLLQEWRQSFVCITLTGDLSRLQQEGIPLIREDLPACLTTAKLTKAKSVVVVTDEDLVNLEVALLTQKLNPAADLIIRTNKTGLSNSLMGLLPQAKVLDIYRLAAEVFVGAAFGENIINLLQVNHKTVLVTEYQIEDHDTLVGLLIGEVAHGYGVVPIQYQQAQHPDPLYFPTDDIILRSGDRLVVLATIEGLKKIEIQDRRPKTWRIVIESVRNEDAAFEGANLLSRMSGCSLKQACAAMANHPQTVVTPLYHPQALRLARSLKKIQVTTRLVELNTAQGNPPQAQL
ncbi:MAG: NAD-binding protein [Synechocystis sp.]|nr:NAD-binding protein [Synechocystis sp.]